MLVNLFSQAKLETKALKAKRPGFTDERYNETSYYHEPENSKMDLFSQIMYHRLYQKMYKICRVSPHNLSYYIFRFA